MNRKLTIDEAQALLNRMKPNTQKLRDLVRSHYGERAKTFLLWSDSEYNDEYYSYSFIVGAFGANGVALEESGYIDIDDVLSVLGIKTKDRSYEKPDEIRMLIDLDAPDTTIDLYVQESE